MWRLTLAEHPHTSLAHARLGPHRGCGERSRLQACRSKLSLTDDGSGIVGAAFVVGDEIDLAVEAEPPLLAKLLGHGRQYAVARPDVSALPKNAARPSARSFRALLKEADQRRPFATLAAKGIRE